MAAVFDGSTSQLSTPTVLASVYPWSAAMWCVPTTTNSGELLFITDAGFSNFFFLNQGGANWGIGASAAGSVTTQFGGSVNPGTPYFILGRFISATNRRMDIWDYNNNTITSIQDTVSKTPGTMTGTGIGNDSNGGTLFAGSISEFWLANIDVQPGGAVTDSAFLWYLAMNGGPWAVPRIAASIQQYKPLLQNFTAGPENYSRGVPPIWTNVGVTLGAPIPLGPGYIRPNNSRRITVI